MSTNDQLERQKRAERITDAIRWLEPSSDTYNECGIPDVDKAYPLLMQDRPREKPATCPLRRKLVGAYLDEIESKRDKK